MERLFGNAPRGQLLVICPRVGELIYLLSGPYPVSESPEVISWQRLCEGARYRGFGQDLFVRECAFLVLLVGEGALVA